MSFGEVKKRYWNVFGNEDTDPTEEFVGTLDATDLRIATNATTRLRYINSTNAVQRTDDGNARGTNAVDFQTVRAAVSQVASGDDSALLAGTNNEVSGNRSAILGGQNNTISDVDSVIIGAGQSNIIASSTGVNNIIGGITSNISGTTALSTVLGGSTNTISAGTANAILSGQLCSISAGTFNTAINSFNTSITGGQLCTIIGGSNCSAAGILSITSGVMCVNDGMISFLGNGSSNTINLGATACSILNGGTNVINAGVFGATILNGFGSTATHAFQTFLNGAVQGSRPLEVIHSGGNFGVNTSAYVGLVGMIASTNSATAVNMLITPGIAAASEFTVPQDHTVNVRVDVVARSTGGVDNAGWSFIAGIKNVGGVLTLVSAAGAIAPAWSDTAAAAAWTVTPSAAGGALRLAVTGTAATNIRWNAQLKFQEVEFA